MTSLHHHQPTPRKSTAADERPVDLVHLARQTMGNHDLEREVLHLFLTQSEKCMSRLGDSTYARRAEAAHTLLGSARGIGAHKVARAAEALERAALADPTAGNAEIEALRVEIETANRFIRSLVFAA
ncbi:Hpt domain-containing protein [Oryzibacter oryziterrae]|uniref:Hpt domain-containing protein n=1 Tax=Oryzibacter oryziterrae TaxID=2766474 RepID=UPI001F003148|nr:Hpt domain-containing protein [Oryzibacter oryziterrae]